MRYRIKKKLSRYQVVTYDGKPVGEHSSAQAARSHLKALRSGVKAPETAAGRRALDSGSFVLSQERKFPVTSPQDVRDAVASWGRYRGPTTFDAFKRNLIDLAKRKGFAASLPKAWGIETKDVATTPGGNYGSGPGGLFANSALGGSRLRKRTKATRTPADTDLWAKALTAAGRRYTTAKSAAALSWAADWYTQHGGAWAEDATAKAKRIAGNLGRANDGQFTAMGGGDEDAPTQKPAKAPKKPPKPPKATDPAKDAARQAEADYRALRRQQIQQDREERRVRQAQRETERQADREQRATDRASRRAEVLQRRADREAARKKREEEKPKGGGGGGGGGKKDDAAGGPNKLDQQLTELRRLAGVYGRRTKAAAAPVASTFAVFKDARGDWRWLAQTTTAYEDRDKEVLATDALAADVARADRDGQYGPLRWWHIGNPDPRNADAPWGAGLDLGMCDFNAMSGRTLIESGTFKTERIARWAAAHADKLGLSPGFFHPATEPDPDGVFRHIRRFERSLAPRERVSNPYTALHITRTAHKETASVDNEKLIALLDMGFDSATLKGLLASTQQTEKAATAAGVRFKAAPTDAPAEVTIGGVVYTLKAPPVMDDAAAEEEEAAKAPDEETLLQDAVDDGQAAHDDAEMDAELIDMKLDDFRQEMKAIIAEQLAPIVNQLKLSEKMEGSVKGLMEEMKAAFGGTATKTAKAADEIATLKARIAELEGGRTAMQQGYRASTADATATKTAETLAVESQPQPLSELAQTLQWASQTATGAFGGGATNGAVAAAPDSGGFLGQPITRQ